MALTSEERARLANLLEQKLAIPMTFTGDRIEAFRLGVDTLLNFLAPFITLDTAQNGKKPVSEPGSLLPSDNPHNRIMPRTMHIPYSSGEMDKSSAITDSSTVVTEQAEEEQKEE